MSKLAYATGTQMRIACRFIYGDPGIDPPGWRYCSREIAPRGKSPAKGSNGVYCSGHLKLMYQEPTKPILVAKGAAV